MGDIRCYTLMLIDDLEPGNYPVHVEGIYRIVDSGWLFDFTLNGKRVRGASPALAVVGTDVGDEAADLTNMRGVKVPLPRHIERIVGTDELLSLPVKRLLFSRDCMIKVGEEIDGPPLPGEARAPQLATLTTTS